MIGTIRPPPALIADNPEFRRQFACRPYPLADYDAEAIRWPYRPQEIEEAHQWLDEVRRLTNSGT